MERVLVNVLTHSNPNPKPKPNHNHNVNPDARQVVVERVTVNVLINVVIIVAGLMLLSLTAFGAW